MRLALVLIIICAGGCSHKPKHVAQQPLAMDCSKNPICPQGQMCTCLPGTFHSQPSFMVDERYGEYEFEIHLDKGWNCKPDVAKDKVTVTCEKMQP